MRYKYVAIPFILGIFCLFTFQIISFFPSENNTVLYLTFLVPTGLILIGLSVLLIIIKMILVIKKP